MKTDKLRRVTAPPLVLAFALPQAAQPPRPQSKTDETVYINMDYYGAPTNTRIVKGVNLNGHHRFTDFGTTKDVYNMSTFDEPVIKDNSGVLELDTTNRTASTTSASRPTRSISRCRGTSMFPTSSTAFRSEGGPVRRRKRHHSDGHSRRAEQLRKRLLQTI